MKRAGTFLAALWAAFLIGQAGAAAPAGDGGGQPRKPGAGRETTSELSAEDREIIEHMDMLKNMKLYDNENMELLLALDVLTANE